MKKILALIAGLMLMAGEALADDFNLYYITNEGILAQQSWEVSSLQKITFENGQINVIATDGTTTVLSTSNIQKLIFFTEETATGIDKIKENEKAVQKGKVYDLSGRRIKTDGNKLPKGFYIIDGKKAFIK
ncbi:MAG: hypothetical protein IJP75_05430 [Bacteroidaceae bacterium]|nr:hypothetical protein [Bacteroidaceae bacterium]